MTFDNRKHPEGEWMHGIFERAAKEFIPVEEQLPDAWHKAKHLAQRSPLADWRFKVKLCSGAVYQSGFVDGQWTITMKNPKFAVTHWVRPIWIG